MVYQGFATVAVKLRGRRIQVGELIIDLSHSEPPANTGGISGTPARTAQALVSPILTDNPGDSKGIGDTARSSPPGFDPMSVSALA